MEMKKTSKTMFWFKHQLCTIKQTNPVQLKPYLVEPVEAGYGGQAGVSNPEGEEDLSRCVIPDLISGQLSPVRPQVVFDTLWSKLHF